MTDPVPEPGTDVALYVHWPYCARICPYCDFNVVRDRGQGEVQAALVAAILADMEAQAALTGPRRLASIFFGGGTPSLMAPEAVAAVIGRARALFPPPGPVEITLEANPTDAEADRFAALADAGVNRLSMGVQALDDAALHFLGRNHSADEARRAVARGAWAPPDEDLAAALYETTQTVLERAGFEAYEVSNHARGVPARSMHNLHVWRGGDYLGVGPGAHGRLTVDGARTATVARRGIADYTAGVAAGAPWIERQAQTSVEAVEDQILLGLRTVEGVPLTALAALGLTPAAVPLADLIADGFLATVAGRLAATPRGRPVLDAVLKALLT